MQHRTLKGNFTILPIDLFGNPAFGVVQSDLTGNIAVSR
jgi:hypothetical protein